MVESRTRSRSPTGFGEVVEWEVRVGQSGRSTGASARIRSPMSDVTSQTLTFMPARTRPPAVQNAMNSRWARSPRTTTCRTRRAGRSRCTPCPGRTGRCRSRAAGRRRRLAEHRPGGGGPGVQRVGPVLDAQVGAEQRVVGVGDVAGGVDMRVAAAQRAGRRRRRCRPPGRPSRRARRWAAPRRRRRPRRPAAPCRRAAAPRTPAVAAELAHRGGEAEGRRRGRGADRRRPGDVGAEHAQQRQVGALDDGDRRRHAAARPRRPRGRSSRRRQRPAARHRPTLRRSGRCRRGSAGAARRRDRRREHPAAAASSRWPTAASRSRRVVRRPSRPAGRPVDGSHRGARAQVDVVFGVPAGIVHEHRVAIGRSQQQTLGQRRPFIGPFGLLAQQDDIAVEAFVPQRLRGLRPGQPGPDDHERTLVVHGLVPFGMPLRRFRSYQRRGGSAAREGSVLRTAKVPCLQRSSGGGSWQHMPPDEIGPTSCWRPATRHHTSGRYPGGGEAAPPRPFPGVWALEGEISNDPSLPRPAPVVASARRSRGLAADLDAA